MTNDLEPVAPARAFSSPIPSESEAGVMSRLASTLFRTDFVPGALRGKKEAVLACILSGRELGIGPMQALQQIHVIDGKPGVSPELMRAMIARAGHRIDFEDVTDERCSLLGTRADTGQTARVVWTVADAIKAGLVDRVEEGRAIARSSHGNPLAWEKYTRAMLLARATSELARMLFADVVAGFGYTPEELHSISGEPDEPERGPVRPQDDSGVPPDPDASGDDESTASSDDVEDAEVVPDDDPDEQAASRRALAEKAAAEAGVNIPPRDTVCEECGGEIGDGFPHVEGCTVGHQRTLEASYATLGLELPAEAREAVKAFRAERGYDSWPMTVEALDACIAFMHSLMEPL